VAIGLAAHLGISVRLVRILFVVLTPVLGVGPLLYAFWWLTVPEGDPAEAAEAARPAAFARLARRQGTDGTPSRLPVTDVAVGVLLMAGAAALLLARQEGSLGLQWVLPAMLVAAGLVLAWSQLDAVQRGRLRERAGGRVPVSVLRLVGGVVLAGVGVLLLVGGATGQGIAPAVLLQAVVAAVAVLAGVGLVLADMAAHLHDSVLQTLALIRARSDEPAEVARMARAQERELREWLYDDRPAPGTSLAAALRAVVAEVEDSRSGPGGEPVAVDTVVVGDRVPDEGTDALLAASREALVNAVVHGRPPVSLYLEVRPDEVEVFVRDHGDGFDVDAIGPDRFGVRESIMGRVHRRGGKATVTSRPDRGTEVHLLLPVGAAVVPPVVARPAADGDGRPERTEVAR
jgi:signal transduction histidine kinase/phage shock protein PspC (stress-responsive transcriptional regulator)